MKKITLLILFFAFLTEGFFMAFTEENKDKENIFNAFFEKRANENGVLEDFSDLTRNGVIKKEQNLESRIIVTKLQLSFEQALTDCISEKKCFNAVGKINTPLPSTPLRCTDKTVQNVTGTNNNDINDVTLKRKIALKKYIDTKSKFIVSYKSNVQKANGNDEYLNLVKKADKLYFSDCKGCYSGKSYALYNFVTESENMILFKVYNTQLKEDKKNDITYVEYGVH